MTLGFGSLIANTITVGQVRSGSATGMTATGGLTNNGATITVGAVFLGDSGVNGCVANAYLTLNNGAFLFDTVQKGSSAGAGSAIINLNGGIFSGINSISRSIGLPINLSGNVTLGQAAVGTGSLTFNGQTTLSSNITLTANVPSTFLAAINQTGGSWGLTKSGSGALTLAATNTYTGLTTINAGTLTLNGSVAGSLLVNGGQFQGGGSIKSNLTVSAGIHAPGNSTGIMSLGGNYALNSGGILQVELNGTVAGSQYDQVKLTGAGSQVSLAGSLNIIAATNLPLGASFSIITNSGNALVSGTFNGLPEGYALFASGRWWRISYIGGSGNDVVLTTIVPPAPKLSGISTSSGNIVFNMSGENGRYFNIETSTNFIFWQLLTNLYCPAGTITFTDFTPLSPARFYRAVLVP